MSLPTSTSHSPTSRPCLYDSTSDSSASSPPYSPGPPSPPSPKWPHPDAVEHVFYVKGVKSHQTRITAFESTEPELFHAVCDKDVALVEKLLGEKHDPNAIFQLKIEFEGENRSYTQYPLHRAVQTGNKDLIDVLLKHGSDPNCTNGQGVTPLYLLLRLLQTNPSYSSEHGVHVVLLLIKAGSDVKFEFTDKQEKIVTPLHLALNKMTTTLYNLLDNISNRTLATSLYPSQWVSGCGGMESEFSILWLLAKSGAIGTWSNDVGCRLTQLEVPLKSVCEKASHLSEEMYWPLHHISAIQKHIQRCLDILQEIHPPMNLLELCRIAVRQALGPGLEGKLEQLGLPVPVKDCILHHDLQAFVDGLSQTMESNPDLPNAMSDSDSSSPSMFSDLSPPQYSPGSSPPQYSPGPYYPDNND